VLTSAAAAGNNNNSKTNNNTCRPSVASLLMAWLLATAKSTRRVEA